MRLAVAAIALALAPVAVAKGPAHASVCGAARCVAVDGDLKVASLLDWQGKPFLVAEPPRPAPYYLVRLRGWGEILYVPARKLMRIHDESPGMATGAYWRAMPRYLQTSYAKLLRGLAPRAAPSHWPG